MKLTVLQLLNGWISFAYLLLAVTAGAIYVTLAARFGTRVAVRPWVIGAAMFGSTLFLAGCGLHHAHLALEMIPDSIHRFGTRSLWITAYSHHVIIAAAQVLGSAMLLGAGAWIVRCSRRDREA